MDEDQMTRRQGPCEVIARFERPGHDFPRTSRALFDYADALRMVGRRSEAMAAYEELEILSVPEDKQSLIFLFKGQALYDQGKFRAAELAFVSACALDESTTPRIFLAGALAAQERFLDAVAVLSEARERPGDPDEVYLNLALNQRALGMLSEAVLSLESALRLTPSYPEAEEQLVDVRAALEFVADVASRGS